MQQLTKPAGEESPFAVAEDKKPASEPALSASGNAAGSQLRDVVAVGYGTTEEEAKANALQNAVHQAIGVLVDATTVIDNDRIITDKVLTYSNGYVENYKILATSTNKGLINVKITARIKVQALSEKLQSLSISMRHSVDGSSLAAAATTKGKRDQDAAAMLADLSQGFPANCLAITAGTPRTSAADSNGTADLTVPVTVKVDPKRYEAFDTALRKLLEKMASRHQSYSLAATDLLSLKPDPWHGGKHAPFHDKFAQPGGVPLYSFLDLEFYSGLSRMHFGKAGDTPRRTFGVALYDIEQSKRLKTSWTVFELSNEHLDFFRKRAASHIPRGRTRSLKDDGKPSQRRRQERGVGRICPGILSEQSPSPAGNDHESTRSS